MFPIPCSKAGLAVQIHASCAVAAVLIGGLVLWRRKGTRLHKALGRVWVVLMLVVATSSLCINEIRLIGPVSPIHLFAFLTYFGIGQGLWFIINSWVSRTGTRLCPYGRPPTECSLGTLCKPSL